MAKKENDNMKLWKSVEVTDPQYTTKINQRGGFTAIGAQYQLQRATETFGPFGAGWGVRGEVIEKWNEVGMAIYQAHLWYKLDTGKEMPELHEFPIHSAIQYARGGRLDDDFFKKVATDALTKGLSKLGFNADVFMGKFDDNKYVNKLTNMSGTWKKEVADAAESLNEKDKSDVLGYIKDGSVNAKNYKKCLTRISELKESYSKAKNNG